MRHDELNVTERERHARSRYQNKDGNPKGDSHLEVVRRFWEAENLHYLSGENQTGVNVYAAIAFVRREVGTLQLGGVLTIASHSRIAFGRKLQITAHERVWRPFSLLSTKIFQPRCVGSFYQNIRSSARKSYSKTVSSGLGTLERKCQLVYRGSVF
jgi:hypothetical protein